MAGRLPGTTRANRPSMFLSYDERQFGDPYTTAPARSTRDLGDAPQHGRRAFVANGVLYEKPARSVTRLHIGPAPPHVRDPPAAPAPLGQSERFFQGARGLVPATRRVPFLTNCVVPVRPAFVLSLLRFDEFQATIRRAATTTTTGRRRTASRYGACAPARPAAADRRRRAFPRPQDQKATMQQHRAAREEQEQMALMAKAAEIDRMQQRLVAEAEKRRDRAIVESYDRFDRFSHTPPRGRRPSIKPNQFGLPTATLLERVAEKTAPLTVFHTAAAAPKPEPESKAFVHKNLITQEPKFLQRVPDECVPPFPAPPPMLPSY